MTKPFAKPSQAAKPGISAALARRCGRKARRPAMFNTWSNCGSIATRTQSGSGSTSKAPARAIPAGARVFTVRSRSARAARLRSSFATRTKPSIRIWPTSRSVKPTICAVGLAAVTRKQRLSANEVRSVVHFALDPDRADTGLRGKGGHHGLGFLDLGARRCEHLIDDGHLRRVNRETSCKSVSSGNFSVAAQSFRVAKINEHSFDRGQVCSRSGVETQ